MVEPEGIEDDSAVKERVQRAMMFVTTLPKKQDFMKGKASA